MTCYVLKSFEGPSTGVADVKASCCSVDTEVDSATVIVLAVALIKRVLRHFVQLLLH